MCVRWDTTHDARGFEAADGTAYRKPCLRLATDELIKRYMWAILSQTAVGLRNQVLGGEIARHTFRMLRQQLLPFLGVLVQGRPVFKKARHFKCVGNFSIPIINIVAWQAGPAVCGGHAIFVISGATWQVGLVV